ncbi:hypothetical protein HLB23_33595 [Nocardia uniformis]|uniref:Uncharacterized protein n=1 Tax=Nocardia uniformis TaxID=53432 RepID=A0A849CAI5_9NOCA|nr:hypothetical protein [Nocardia uniformis]NNH74728.1 hypothetical protein [Nocardia uniformis]
MNTFSRRIGTGVAGFATVAAVAVFAAPNASATVDSITVSGSNHVINTEYALTAKLSGAGIGLLVYWSDNGKDISGPKVPWPVGEAHLDWTPTTAGRHLITASQGGSTKTIEVMVKDPSNPDPDPDPETPGGGSGSASKMLSGLFGSS